MAFITPAIAAYAAAAASVIGAGVAAYGSIQQGNAANAQAKSQAQAEQYNATVQKNQAQLALEQAGADEDAKRRDNRVKLGAIAAGLSENGIGLDGSGADVFRQSAAYSELDALNIRYGGVLKSQGYQAGSALSTLQADAARRAGSTAQTSGYLSAGAALLNGVSSAYSGYQTNKLKSSGY